MKHTKFKAAMALVALVSVSTSLAATGTTTVTSGTTTVTTAAPTASAVSSAPRLVKKTSNSVSLEWDKIANASAYIVKYSKTSVANSTDPNAQYDNESDQVTATGIVIDKLSSTNEKHTPNTVYYFSVVAVDKDGKESDTFSDELMVTTDAASTVTSSTGVAAPVTTSASSAPVVSSLSVADVAVTNDATLTVTFNANLSSDDVKVKVTKKNDNSEVAVDRVEKNGTNPKAATVLLAGKLVPTSSYTLTIISAKDTAGNNIDAGVNGLKEFTTPEQMAVVAGTSVAPTDASGATLSGALSPESATKVATGTAQNLLILAALVLSMGIVYIYRRKLS